MSCRHGCETWYGPSHGYCGPSIGEPDWFEGWEWQGGRRPDRRRPAYEGRTRGSLEARVDDLQAELDRVEAMLIELRGLLADAPYRGPRPEAGPGTGQ